MATYEQLPSRAYPARAFPLRMLAHGGAATGTYPDGEQRPKRAYPLRVHPLRHLARVQDETPIGGVYPDSEQRPKRGYPLGSHPLHHLARANGSTPVPPIPGGGGAGGAWINLDPSTGMDRRFRKWKDEQDLMAIIYSFLNTVDD